MCLGFEEKGARMETKAKFLINLFAGGTMNLRKTQAEPWLGEILRRVKFFALSKLDKIYVDLTPLSNTNAMVQSVS